MTWLPAFVLTFAIEVPLALVVLGARPRVAAAAVAATAITHPLLWFVLVPELPGRFAARAIAGEAIVVAIEAVVYMAALRLRPAHALAASAFLNGASYLVGLVIAGA